MKSHRENENLQVIGKDKNVQNWQVYQDLKSDLETFRNMMLSLKINNGIAQLTCCTWITCVSLFWQCKASLCALVFVLPSSYPFAVCCVCVPCSAYPSCAARMPVITHLRSDAMRERHIEAIIKEVKARSMDFHRRCSLIFHDISQDMSRLCNYIVLFHNATQIHTVTISHCWFPNQTVTCNQFGDCPDGRCMVCHVASIQMPFIVVDTLSFWLNQLSSNVVETGDSFTCLGPCSMYRCSIEHK